MTTRYERDGDDWLLNGTKRFITGAGVSHAYVVFATKDPSMRSKGVSAFLVMKDDPGVEFGRKEDKMGIRGSPTREVIVTDTRIPADRLIGQEEAVRVCDANARLLEARDRGQALGIAQGALDVASRYATERHQFGKAVSEFQACRSCSPTWRCARPARLLVYKALALCDAGDPDDVLLQRREASPRTRR